MLKTARQESSSRAGRRASGPQGHSRGEGPFGTFSPSNCWRPAINYYHLGTRLELCVDLAGVDKASVNVDVEPGRLTITGERHAPAPPDLPQGTRVEVRLLEMQIDHGPYRCDIPLPPTVRLDQVTSQYRDGLLWVRLPLRIDA